MTLPYPIPQQIRQTDILLGNGGPLYSGFNFKIFDVDDIEAWTMVAGETHFSKQAVSVAKVANLAFDDFTVTFSANQLMTTEIIIRSVRLDDRAAGVLSGTSISPDALEKEFSKFSTIVQELRRDIDRAAVADFGQAGFKFDAGLQDGDTLMIEGDRIVTGPAADAIASAQGYAEQVVQALADATQLTTPGDATVSEQKLASALKQLLIRVVPDRAAMRALDTTLWTQAHLASIGLFGWDATDLAAQMITVQRNVTFHNVNTVANQLQYTDFPTGIPTPISSHGFVTGDPVYLPVATDGLAADTIFYVIKISESNIKLASSKANAIAGVALTLTGTADMALQVLRDIGQIRYVLKVGAKLNGSQGAWRAINAKSSSGDGWTRVFPPNSDWARANGTGVRLPDGTALDTTGTTTQGIQEAINFSCGNGKRGSGNSDLEIIGGIEKTGNYQQDGGVVYNCIGGLQFPAIENKRIKGGSLTLNLPAYGPGDGAGLTFDSAMMCDIDMMALNLVYFGTGHCIRFDARTPVPADGIVFGVTAITGCQFKFQALSSVGSATGTLGAVVGIYANTASINLNDFLFSELNGGDGAAVSRLAFCVADPSAGGAVTENYIKIINIHNCSSGIQDGLAASGRVTGNHYEFTAQGNGLGGEALSSFATNSSYELSVPGGFAKAVNMQIGAFGNVLIGKGPIIGTLLNSGGGTNRLYRAKQRAVGAQSVAASPVTFQNTTFEQVSLSVNGGTVSSISLKTAAGVTVNTGLTQGLFALEPYESLVITYTAAPSVNLLS